MLIVALVMAVIGLAALVAAVITNNEVIAWVCIGASAFGVVLLIVDAVRERQRRDGTPKAETEADEPAEAEYDEDYPDEKTSAAAEKTAGAPGKTAEVAVEDDEARQPQTEAVETATETAEKSDQKTD
jgi:hypothetical protein